MIHPNQYHDTESGLHYNYHRYYDPAIGRYISQDPIGQLGGVNIFAYAWNDPVNWADPFGLVPFGSLTFEQQMSCIKAFALEDFFLMNDLIFGSPLRVLRSGSAFITGGAVMRATGLTTNGRGVRGLLGFGGSATIRQILTGNAISIGVGAGVANLGVKGTIVSMAAGTAVNTGVAVIGLEIGFGIGATANAVGRAIAGECPAPHGDVSGACDAVQ